VSHRRYSAEANGFSFSGRDQTSRAFVQNASEDFELVRQTTGVWH
jgi:hypothetical protein